MEKQLPNKYIRKALFNLLDGIIVDGVEISVYDTRVTGIAPDHYILMITQTNDVDKSNKCEYFWDSTIVLDITTTFARMGNRGSRLLLDNIVDAVREELETPLILESGLSVIFQQISFPGDISTVTENEIVHRCPLRLQLKIK